MEAARKLEIPEDTLYTWIAKVKKGMLQTESKPKEVKESADELDRLREEIRALKLKEKADKVEMENFKKDVTIPFIQIEKSLQKSERYVRI